MKPIPLTRARHAASFAIALLSKGLPVAKYLERSRLPSDLLGAVCGDSVISAANMLSFAELAAKDTGVSDLGYWAGIVPIESYGTFGARVAEPPALHAAIQTFCGNVRSECSEADYYLLRGGEKAWLCHGRDGSNALQHQHELYALMIMVQVIRLALGSDWTPARIRLQRRDETGVADNDFFLSTNVEFGAPYTGISFGLADLATSINGSRNKPQSSNASTPGKDADALPVDHLVALQELIRKQLRQSVRPTVGLVAEEAGVSTRTLQRYLSDEATSFSRLLDQVRYDMAVGLLHDDTITITDVAEELGYSNVAHFSRAFSRITGMCPRSYRDLLKE